MRSYYAHLESTVNKGLAQKPILRSSAIFPAMQRPGISTRLLFMGYWMLKRNMREIAMVLTLRSQRGEPIFRDYNCITEAKAYRIELADCLEKAGRHRDENFEGSLEVEFFSTQNLFFPYPAVTVNYYGPEFSSVVHTAQRVFNDFEDKKRNTESTVPECGFNIYAQPEREAVIGLVNGPEEAPAQSLQMTVYNLNLEELLLDIPLQKLAPYETVWIFPAHHADLVSFLQGKPGTAKVRFHLRWVFPRLLAGNLQRAPNGLVITHTYYDTSESGSDKDYWLAPDPGWQWASLMLPVDLSQGANTSLYFYPIYSPSSFTIGVEIYDQKGCLIKKDDHYLSLGRGGFHRLDLQSFCQDMEQTPLMGVRLVAYPKEEDRLPARVKLALDIGHPEQALPCNICTNLQPYVPGWRQKPSTFRWGPILADQPHAQVWIMNSSPAEPFQKEAKVQLTIYREQDTRTLEREWTIPPHGFILLSPETDPELAQFLEGKIGWFTAISDNPYTTTYYFAKSQAGIVGGDHGY